MILFLSVPRNYSSTSKTNKKAELSPFLADTEVCITVSLAENTFENWSHSGTLEAFTVLSAIYDDVHRFPRSISESISSKTIATVFLHPA